MNCIGVSVICLGVLCLVGILLTCLWNFSEGGSMVSSVKEPSKPIYVPTVLLHGGSGPISEDRIPYRMDAIKVAARKGYEAMRSTGSALDAVQEAVRSMELSPYFNAGYGSALTSKGTVEMDAAIMNGANLEAGCVSLARDIYNPVLLARAVMEKSRHTYLVGDGLMAFAKEQGFEILAPGSLFSEMSLEKFEKYKKKKVSLGITNSSIGTVGAVAIDEYGNVAAATSTGGFTGKMPGRVGDSSVLGAGTYADNARGAVSVTGIGETFMQYNVAARILALIEYKERSAQQAIVQVLDELNQRFKRPGGAINIDAKGTLGIYWTTPRMAWAYQRGEELHYGIEKGEDNVEIVGNPCVRISDETAGKVLSNCTKVP